MIAFDGELWDLHFRYFKGIQWLLIFFHNITGKIYFDNENDALNCHEKQKYSILYYIDDVMKIDNKFEFLLQYGSSRTKYNHWRQLKNPLEQSEEQEEADGFDPIHLDYSSNFGGLAKTTIKGDYTCINSLLNGYFNHHYWYYGIGQYDPCDNKWEESIPSSHAHETTVDLWIRVSPTYHNIYASLFKKKSFTHIKSYLLNTILYDSTI